MTPSCSFAFTHRFTDTAVYWGNPTTDGYGGRTFDDPIEVPCRWQQTQELFIDTSGKEVRSQAVCYVDRDLDLGGFLYLGTLASLSSAEEGSPYEVANAFEIRSLNKTHDLAGGRYLRKVWL